MKTLNNDVVHDDMHARAILLRVMREARESYLVRYRKLEKQGIESRSVFKRYKKTCELQKGIYGDALVFDQVSKSSRGRREKTYLVAFGGLQLYEEDFKSVKEGKLYPVTLEIIDSKLSPWEGIRTIFY